MLETINCVQIKLFMLYIDIWSHLRECKQMINSKYAKKMDKKMNEWLTEIIEPLLLKRM